MKKILFVITVDWTFITHRLHLAEKAIEDGYEVAILTKFTKYESFIRAKGIKTFHWNVSRNSLSPINSIVSILMIRNVLKKWRPNIVHSVSIKSVIYSGLVLKAYPKICFVAALGGLGFIFSSKKIKAKILRYFVKILLFVSLLGKKNRLILQNPDDSNLVQNLRIIDKNNIRIIKGAGVEVNKFYPKDFPNGLPIVILPGRLLWDKGLQEFVECAEIIKKKGYKARFVIVGQFDTENPEAISKKTIRTWEEKKIIEYWGHKNDMHKIYLMSSIVCFPSYREGLPKVLLEAASCGRPIVAFDVPGSREIVKHNINGLLVPFKNVKLLEKSILKLIKNKNICKKLGKNGRKIVEKNFSDKKIYDETIKVWDEFFYK